MPQASNLFDKFYVIRHLGKVFDKFKKQEHARLTGPNHKFIKGQK